MTQLSSSRRWAVLLVLAACFVLLLNQLSFKFGISLPQNAIDIPDYPAPAKIDDSRFHWHDVPTKYPPSTLQRLPTGKPRRLPKVQHDFGTDTVLQDNERWQRQKAVKDTFLRCWSSYKQRAWLKDELAPLSGGYRNAFGGWAATLVDTLDTLHIMGMSQDFDIAVAATKDIDFSTSDEETLNIFETTIRYLGGLLSAYDLSGERILIDKAVELGEMLYVAFDTPNRMPVARWDWRRAAAGNAQVASTGTLDTASACSVQ
jgi:mannosyl-oligosaccharide alpha-1,2-mannosidase